MRRARRYAYIQPLSAFACILYIPAAFRVLSAAAGLPSGRLAWIRKTRSKGNKGKAEFVTHLREIKGDLIPYPKPAMYLGVFRKHRFAAKQAVFADTASNAICVGTTGSGKGVSVILTNLCALFSSFVVIDPKGTNAVIMKDYLIRKGFRVFIVDTGGLPHIKAIHPHTDSINPLDIIRNGFYTPGEITSVISDAAEFSHQILPEPESDGADKFWRDGARSYIQIIAVYVIIIKNKRANVGDILQTLSDKKALIKDMTWLADVAVGSDGERVPGLALETLDWVRYHDEEDVCNFIAYLRKKASGIADLTAATDSKTADSFISAAKLALESYNITSKPFKAMKESTFDPQMLKSDPDRPVAVFIVTDNSRPETQMPAAGLILWTILTILKRHKNKHVPTYLMADETNSFFISGLPEMQSWIREYSIRWIGFIQSMDAYKKLYSDSGLKTMWSETEIKIILPGIREQETLELLEKMLGQKSYTAYAHNTSGENGTYGKSASEESKPLMSADEIRRTKKAIIIIRGNRPLLVDMPSIGAIKPWRSQIGDNPFHQGKYQLPIQLRIRERKGTLRQRLRRGWKAYFRPD